ncbi:MAG: hypothetical protein JWN88_487 [Frankiales bacterium]|jgi:hypothetical protein|nr:hypothetical protein [Frankiales bacterium]
MTDPVRQARHAGSSEGARTVVLLGWAAKGVVYVALAYVVLQLGFGSATHEANTTGAMRSIAGTGPGALSLVVLAVGLLAFAVGRVLEATTLAGPDIGTSDQVKAGLYAVLYTSLALTAFRLVSQGGGGAGGGGKEQQGSAFLLGLPAGRFLVGALGLAVVAYGLAQAWKGVQHAFLGTLNTGRMSASLRSGVTKLGTAAYVTKGLTVVLLGYFFLQSAVKYDPQQAKGLDAALGEIAQGRWGQALLTLIALGLLAYGVFAFVEARYRKVGSSVSGTT